MYETGIIILAAGASSRLGKPKQLLSFQRKTFIERVTGEAIKAELHPVVVITGAHADKVSLILNDEEGVTIVHNEHWQKGMASGIVAGISKALLLNSHLKNIITAVCDQPFVSAELFLEMIKEKKETGKGIVACAYADTIGTPVLFDRNYFQALQKLNGSEGAKKLMKMYEDDVATVLFPQGEIDIDTEEDYKNLLR